MKGRSTMANKEKKEKVNANNLRSAGFADFEANHTFTKDSKKADYTRAALTAGLSIQEVCEIGDGIYGAGGMKPTCVSWYKNQDPVLNPGKERYKATGARSIAVKSTVIEYFNGLDQKGQAGFLGALIEKVGAATIIESTKTDVLKEIAPAELFPEKAPKEKKEMTAAEKILNKQKKLEAQQAKLQAELAALETTPTE
jgi:hypothetical protein